MGRADATHFEGEGRRSQTRKEYDMTTRSWFAVIAGQQTGPYSDEQLHDLISQGRVNRDSMVWCEGMQNWQRASDIPGLIPPSHMPPPIPSSGVLAIGMQQRTDSLATTATVGPLIGRTILVAICQFLIIPAPWVATAFYRWFVNHLRMPRGERMEFVGKAEDMWHVFMLSALCGYAGFIPIPFLSYLIMPLTAFLGLVLVRWFVSNLVADGRLLPLKFTGSYWPYLGWSLLLSLSFFTIIGWAWVGAAFMRWMCRNVSGTNTKIVFTASGWEYLWRTVLFGLSCAVLIPIPWTYHWYVRWFLSRMSLENR